jgi:hypothetical protein
VFWPIPHLSIVSSTQHNLSKYLVVPLAPYFILRFLPLITKPPTKGIYWVPCILKFVHITNYSILLQVSQWYHLWSTYFKNPFAFCSHASLPIDFNTSFQKGGIFLALIILSMRSLERNWKSHHFFIIPLCPLTFDFKTTWCYGESYYATIAVFSTNQRPMNLIRPSIPQIHRHSTPFSSHD